LRVKQIIYDGEFRVVERDIVAVKRGELLVKPLYVYIGLFEDPSVWFKYPVKIPVVPGSFGVVRVLESIYGEQELSGKLVVFNPIGSEKILGLDVDGLLSTYTGINKTYVYEVVQRDNPYYSLLPLIKHAISLYENSSGKTLIVGCNTLSIISSIAYDLLGGIEYYIYCPEKNILRRFYGRVAINTGELDKNYESIVITSNDYPLIYEVLNSIGYKILIISRYSLVNNVILKRNGIYRLVYIGDTGISPDHVGVVNKVLSRIKKHIRIVKLDDLGKTTSLLPQQKPGVIIGLTSSRS
jgi:hypothetical protein